MASPHPSNDPFIGKSSAGAVTISAGAIENLLRLPSFSFGRQPLFNPLHRGSIHRALGAVNRSGRAGRQSTVLKRLTIIFRNAVQAHFFYPSYGLESRALWTTILSDVCEEEPQLAADLNMQALVELVGVYTQAYSHGHEEEIGEAGDIMDDTFDSVFELLTPTKSTADPKKKLISLVRVWAKVFRGRNPKTTPKITAKQTDEEAVDEASTSPYPSQLPDESDKDYIVRLQTTIKNMACANKSTQNEIEKLKRSQKLADQLNQNYSTRLHATMCRTDAKLKETESELRLARIGAGGGEDDPWVRYRDYADQLDGSFGKP